MTIDDDGDDHDDDDGDDDDMKWVSVMVAHLPPCLSLGRQKYLSLQYIWSIRINWGIYSTTCIKRKVLAQTFHQSHQSFIICQKNANYVKVKN